MKNTHPSTTQTQVVHADRPPLRDRDFSSPDEMLAAAKAESDTGLHAREIFRRGRRATGGRPLFPRDPRLRCQLGRKYLGVQFRSPAIRGLRDAVDEIVNYFELVAYGSTWDEAVMDARRRGKA